MCAGIVSVRTAENPVVTEFYAPVAVSARSAELAHASLAMIASVIDAPIAMSASYAGIVSVPNAVNPVVPAESVPVAVNAQSAEIVFAVMTTTVPVRFVKTPVVGYVPNPVVITDGADAVTKTTVTDPCALYVMDVQNPYARQVHVYVTHAPAVNPAVPV